MLGVLRVDLHSHVAQEVSVAGHFTLAGIDGLYWYRGGLVGLQYGAGAYRAMQWRLAADGMQVALGEDVGIPHGTRGKSDDRRDRGWQFLLHGEYGNRQFARWAYRRPSQTRAD
jgi:hypothetical protein